ncbi:hypothetical protein ABE437_18770 [Isoptericola cucumis]|uniref:hypothetical protein n=1 Tax=Isoptericola cucumis TaxID=1776856 RepID=UPI00320A3119
MEKRGNQGALIAYRVTRPGPPDDEGRVLVGYTEFREPVRRLPDGTHHVEYDFEARKHGATYAPTPTSTDSRRRRGGVTKRRDTPLDLVQRRLARLVKRAQNNPQDLPKIREKIARALAELKAMEDDLDRPFQEVYEDVRQQMLATQREMRRTAAPSTQRGTESFHPVPKQGEVL